MQENNSEYNKINKIMNIFYNEELQILDDQIEINEKEKGTVNIAPRILYDRFTGNIKVEFFIGKSKKYKIKDIAEFYKCMTNNEYYKYGDKVGFIHKREVINEKSLPMLDFIMKYAETIKMANTNIYNSYNYSGTTLDSSKIAIRGAGLDELFEILKNKDVEFQIDGKKEEVQFKDENPNIVFELNKKNINEYVITTNTEIFNVRIIPGKDYEYVLKRNCLYKCSKKFRESNLKLLKILKEEYISELVLGNEEIKKFFSIMYPKLKDAININAEIEKEIKQYKPEDLIIKVFLDYDEKDRLTADIKFKYGMVEFNPLDESKEYTIPRNIIKETKSLNLFKKSGFMFDIKNLRFILPSSEEIYKFLVNDINEYTQKFEVNVTEKFKSKQIKQTNIGKIGVKIENSVLNINLEDINIDINEIERIINQYKEKKNFYRLRNGEFITLKNNNEIGFLEKLYSGMEVPIQEIKSGHIEVPIYRTLYFNQLLPYMKDSQIEKNEKYKELIENLNKENIDWVSTPKELENTLRYYQKIGFKWLKILDEYKFGGILADDMGLGKTVQILSIIVDYVKGFSNEAKGKRASLVISPSSLTLNWKNEVKKFAGDLKTLVIRGDVYTRKKQIEQIDDYDLVITSYDLLKRDIDLYQEKDYRFRYIIADEAQYLKNSSTQNAKTIKAIKGDTKYALTGTPIENTLAELWSIFDFIMPGYLFDYRKFNNSFEKPIVKNNDIETMEKLKMLIQPFILRRTKKEVLTELPEKSVTILNNEMEEEQRNIYMSYLAQAKKEIAETLKVEDLKNNQMKILTALTRLRQICCHPSLFIDNYEAGSSKLEQCIEIIKDAVKSNHKILLFSSYTSMFGIIEEELKKENINYFKLTGSTKIDERMEMIDEFNENKDIKVFLISLKAGGTGLNLTGADMVIHYDPWWNLSAENQATDRAYRIGQKNNVQVYKMITKNTIEEKIYDLQQRKAQLIDNMLDTKTVFLNKLSKEELLNLFE